MGLAYSIVGVDVDRGLIGAAGGVCTDKVAPNIVAASYNHVFGKGVFVSNALLVASDSFPWLTASAELGKGTNPADILSIITDPTKDKDFAIRQYGMVDFQGRSASYTGTGLADAKVHYNFCDSSLQSLDAPSSMKGWVRDNGFRVPGPHDGPVGCRTNHSSFGNVHGIVHTGQTTHTGQFIGTGSLTIRFLLPCFGFPVR